MKTRKLALFSTLFYPLVSDKESAIIPWYLAGEVSAANCVAAYQPIGATSLAESYVNLINPGTNNAAPGTAPTFNTATGWTFNGSSQYLTTGITPVIQTWSVLIQFTNVTGNNASLFGAYLTSGFGASFQISPRASGGTRVDYTYGSTAAKAPIATAGNVCITGNLAYRNGVDEGISIPSGAGTLLPIFIGAVNSTVGALNHQACNIQAFAIYNTILTPSQVVAIAARMAVLPL